uniref:Uncharacterized protein n=1 Tax=Sphaeramia orbicularis TaxID=375764 RepID=A0A673BPK1_9TELE
EPQDWSKPEKMDEQLRLYQLIFFMICCLLDLLNMEDCVVRVDTLSGATVPATAGNLDSVASCSDLWSNLLPKQLLIG